MINPDSASLALELETAAADEFPCSLIQKRLWLLEQSDPGASSRNVAARWRLEGQIDPETIRAALEAVSARHEILRTVFAARGEEIVQRVFAKLSPIFSVVDLSRVPADERVNLANAIGEKEGRKGFDVVREPLFRAVLLVLDSNSATLLVTLHSMICDGWSVGLLAHEIGAMAQMLNARQTPELPELPLQYVDYALWQEEYLKSDAFIAERDFWRRALAGDAIAALPSDRPRPEASSRSGKILSILLPAQLSSQLDDACKQAEVSLFSAASSALNLTLRAYSSADVVQLGTQVAGREAVELEGLIGPLANTVLLRLDASGNPTMRGLAARTADRVREALVHQTAPYEAIQADIGIASDAPRVNFILQRSFVANESFDKFKLIDMPSHSTGALYDLSFFMIGRPEGWRISCELDPELYDEATASAILENWRLALETFATQPQLRLSALPAPLQPERPSQFAFPCTPPQRRCWFLDQFNPGSPALNVPVTWEIRGRVDDDQVETALRTIIARHEILRTRIFEQDSAPAQQPLDDVAFDLKKVDASAMPADDQHSVMERERRDIAQASFDLTAPPLMRAVLVRRGPSTAHLSVTFHQSVFDGWSLRVFGHELGLLLQAYQTKSAPDLPKLKMQYADYAVQQQGQMQSQAFAEDETYWREQLKGVPYFEVATDRPRGATRTSRCATRSAILAPETGKKIEDAAKAMGVSAFAFGTASVGAMLHLFTGAGDILVGTQVSSRQDVDHESLIGVFINNVVLRLRAGEEDTFQSLLGGLSETVRDALVHKDMPFDHLVEILNPPRDPARTPLIAVNLVIRRTFLETERFGDIELAALPAAPANALYDLTFELVARGDEWRAGIEYNSDLYDAETADEMLALWRSVIDAGVAQPAMPLARLAPAHQRLAVNADESNRSSPALRIERSLRGLAFVAEAWAGELPGSQAGAAPYAYVAPQCDLPAALETWPAQLMQAVSATLQPHERPSGISAVLRLPRNAAGAVDIAKLPLPIVPKSIVKLPTNDQEPPAKILAAVCRIWREALNIEAVEPSDNFFELGGHSLLALRMMAAVRREFGVVPHVAVLFAAPTPRDFALAIAGLVSTEPDAPPETPNAGGAQIINIQPEGDLTPIIAFSNTVVYYNLARKIGLDRPFIGVQLFDAEQATDLKPRSLQEIAADYVECIRKARPHGPYILMGLCVSGIAAFEAAQQLKRAGEEVPLVIVGDAGVPHFRDSSPLWKRALHKGMDRLRVARHHLSDLATGKTSIARLMGSSNLLHKIGVTPLAERLGWIPAAELGEGWRNRWFQPIFDAACHEYRPDTFDGDVVVLLSDKIEHRFVDPQMGWGKVVGGKLSVARAPGWHADMFQGGGSDMISELLRPLLQDVENNISKD